MYEDNLKSHAIAFRNGDSQAFKRLVDSLSRTLIAMAFRYTRDWDIASDLTQEIWIKVYHKIRQFNPDRSFRNWLYAIHRNNCLSYLRKASFRYETATIPEEIEHLSGILSIPAPDEELERREFHRNLMSAVWKLSEGQRQVFIRVDLEQVEQKEVARILGIKPTTLRTTLHFARKRLAGILLKTEAL